MNHPSLETLRPKLAEWRQTLVQPWLVAAWPGMGMVAQLAATYLARRLVGRPIGDLPADDHFDHRAIEVERGLILPPRLPKNTLYGWRSPGGKRDLVFFESDAQPEHGAHRFCEELVAAARELGAVRVCTFAAMATLIRPEAAPRVFAAASDLKLLDELRRVDTEPLESGSIGGLNGLLLEVAAKRGLGGLCLLGEMPYFASSIPNPKASAAVLRAFARLAGVEVDLAELDAHAATVERSLVEHLKRAEKAAAEHPESDRAKAAQGLAEPPSAAEVQKREIAARIEALFEEARKDRTKAPQLKAELDRHGMFREYQDRFLDLWKRAD